MENSAQDVFSESDNGLEYSEDGVEDIPNNARQPLHEIAEWRCERSAHAAELLLKYRKIIWGYGDGGGGGGYGERAV